MDRGMTSDRQSGVPALARVPGWLWYALALAACLSVLAINGRPLFYWDTVGYITQGSEALEQVGLIDPAPAAADPSGADPAGTAAATPKATVDGSRSIAYSLFFGALAQLGVLDLADIVHALAVLAAVWLPARIAARVYAPDLPVAALVGLPVLAASLGSLPFVVSYLMPDIFAPILLLMIATLAAFGRHMTRGECLLAVALGATAVVAHLSHLAIAAAMVPVAILAALILSGWRGIRGSALVILVLMAGFGQQVAFRAAASRVADAQVVIKPFITARLIQDGVGYDYLADTCPDAATRTCLLYTELQKSADPWRLTASNILFRTDQNLGSLKRMPEQDQRLVAQEQRKFFIAVLQDRPFAVLQALTLNTFRQAGMFSVDMTIPTKNIVDQHIGVPGMIGGSFQAGRLSPDGGWLTPLTWLQGVLYAASLAVTCVLLVQRDRLPKDLRGFAIVVLLGILANAFVCGALSQPATRYGMRVIWLLPLLAAMLLLFARFGRGGVAR